MVTERFYWPRLAWGTVAYFARVRKPMALVRALWSVIRHDFGEQCQECGRGYWQWRATTRVWTAVRGERTSGTFCPACFTRLAEKSGMEVLWIVRSLRDNDPIPWMDEYKR